MKLDLSTPERPLSQGEAARFSRHMSIPSIGIPGQQRLRAARVLVVGAGGLGSPAIMYLAGAGIGTLGIVDDDVVDESNLQRQVIHSTNGIGRPKVESAEKFVNRLDADIDVIQHRIRLDETNVMDLVSQYDVIVDGSDNFTTRYLVNDACALLEKPCVWGSVYQFSGQASVFWKNHGPCYRCLFPEPPPAEYAPSCAEGGVFGAVCGTIGALQAAETIKLISGVGEPLLGRMWVQDSSSATTKVLGIAKDPNCPLCGDNPTISSPQTVSSSCLLPTPELPAVSAEELESMIASDSDFGELEIWDIREEFEWASGTIPGAMLVGSNGLAQKRMEEDHRQVVIYCQGGVRSSRALPTLLDKGISAKHLTGGIDAWTAMKEHESQ